MKIHKYYFNFRLLVAAVVWIIGMLLALAFSVNASDASLRVFCSALLAHPEPVGYFLLLTFPLLFSALLLRLAPIGCVYLFLFLKSFVFFYCAFCLELAAGSAGWLARCLMLFSGTVSVVMLLVFLFGNLCKARSSFAVQLLVCATFTLAAGCVDFYVISPFLMGLLN